MGVGDGTGKPDGGHQRQVNCVIYQAGAMARLDSEAAAQAQQGRDFVAAALYHMLYL